jgi:hypothetical protein
MLFLEEVNSLSQRSILTFNSFHLVKAIRGEKEHYMKLRNTTPKYHNASTQIEP